MLSSIRLAIRLRSSLHLNAFRAFATESAKPASKVSPAPLGDDDQDGWRIQSHDPKDYGPNDVIDATMHGTLEWLISSPPEMHLFDEPPVIYEAEPAKKE